MTLSHLCVFCSTVVSSAALLKDTLDLGESVRYMNILQDGWCLLVQVPPMTESINMPCTFWYIVFFREQFDQIWMVYCANVVTFYTHIWTHLDILTYIVNDVATPFILPALQRCKAVKRCVCDWRTHPEHRGKGDWNCPTSDPPLFSLHLSPTTSLPHLPLSFSISLSLLSIPIQSRNGRKRKEGTRFTSQFVLKLMTHTLRLLGACYFPPSSWLC